MRTGWIVCALIGATSLLAATAFGQPAPERARENAHHQVVQIELRSAIDHARALHQIAHDDARAMARDVLARHLIAIQDELDAMDSQITAIQEIDGDGSRFDYEIAEIRNHAGLAHEELAAMIQADGSGPADAACIDAHAASLYHLLSRATDHDRRTLAMHRVRQPVMPTD